MDSNKGFNSLHSQRILHSKVQEPFYKVSNGDYDYPENINFQHSKYECLALPYGYFVSAMLAGNNTLHITFNSWEVFIDGRNLKPIYEAILNRSLKSIRKAEAGEEDNADLGSYISHLQVKDNNADTLLGKSPRDAAESEVDADTQQEPKEE